MADGFPRCPRCGHEVMGLLHSGLCWVCDYEKGHPGAVRQYCRDCIHYRNHSTYDKDLPGHSCALHLEEKSPDQFHYECRTQGAGTGQMTAPDGPILANGYNFRMETDMQNVKCKEVSAEYLKSIGFHFENGTLERAEVTDINGVATVNAVIRLSSGGHCSLGGYGCGQYIPHDKSIKGSRFGFESLLWLMAVAGVSGSAELGGQFVRVALDSNDRASFIGHIVEDRWFCFATLCRELDKE